MEDFGLTYIIGTLKKDFSFFEELNDLITEAGFSCEIFLKEKIIKKDIGAFLFPGEKISLLEEDILVEDENITLCVSAYSIEYGLCCVFNLSTKSFLTDELCERLSFDKVLNAIPSSYFYCLLAKGLVEEEYNQGFQVRREHSAIRVEGYFKQLLNENLFDFKFINLSMKRINMALSCLFFNNKTKLSSVLFFLSDSKIENKITDEKLLGEKIEVFFLIGYLASCFSFFHYFSLSAEFIPKETFNLIEQRFYDIEIISNALSKELKECPENNFLFFVSSILDKLSRSKILLKKYRLQ